MPMTRRGPRHSNRPVVSRTWRPRSKRQFGSLERTLLGQGDSGAALYSASGGDKMKNVASATYARGLDDGPCRESPTLLFTSLPIHRKPLLQDVAEDRLMNRWLRSACIASCVALSCASITLGSVSGPLASKLDGTPPAIPVGGKSADEIKAKMKSGEIKRISRVPQLPEKVEAQRDVEYGKGGEKPLLLDLYKPKEMKKPAPGLIFVHGGSWSRGDRKIYGYYCQHFAEKGYVAATIEYRLSGEAPFPAAIQDVKCAIRWMRERRQVGRRSQQDRTGRRFGGRAPGASGRLCEHRRSRA